MEKPRDESKAEEEQGVETEIINDILDDVIQSTTVQPSIPGVVLDTVQGFVEEGHDRDVGMGTGEHKDIPIPVSTVIDKVDDTHPTPDDTRPVPVPDNKETVPEEKQVIEDVSPVTNIDEVIIDQDDVIDLDDTDLEEVPKREKSEEKTTQEAPTEPVNRFVNGNAVHMREREENEPAPPIPPRVSMIDKRDSKPNHVDLDVSNPDDDLEHKSDDGSSTNAENAEKAKMRPPSSAAGSRYTQKTRGVSENV